MGARIEVRTASQRYMGPWPVPARMLVLALLAPRPILVGKWDGDGEVSSLANCPPPAVRTPCEFLARRGRNQQLVLRFPVAPGRICRNAFQPSFPVPAKRIEPAWNAQVGQPARVEPRPSTTLIRTRLEAACRFPLSHFSV